MGLPPMHMGIGWTAAPERQKHLFEAEQLKTTIPALGLKERKKEMMILQHLKRELNHEM